MLTDDNVYDAVYDAWSNGRVTYEKDYGGYGFETTTAADLDTVYGPMRVVLDPDADYQGPETGFVDCSTISVYVRGGVMGIDDYDTMKEIMEILGM